MLGERTEQRGLWEAVLDRGQHLLRFAGSCVVSLHG